MLLPESVREASDVLCPVVGSMFARATVTTTEVIALPWPVTSGNGVNDSHFWTFIASTADVYLAFNTSSSITVTVADNSSLAGAVITADVNTGYLLLAGQRADFRVPRTMTHFGHNSLVTTGRLFFYMSGGAGNQ